jgi:orotidine-5'-phosphate decarboxylase
LVNSSRGILYAGNDLHFAEASTKVAKEIQQEMSDLLQMI